MATGPVTHAPSVATILTPQGAKSFVILIPSKGRPAQWVKTIKAMPWLNAPATFLGLETDEVQAYQHHMIGAGIANRATIIQYDNPTGSVAVAREYLRRNAVKRSPDFYIVTDDNAKHKSFDVLVALVRCAAAWPKTIVAGYHNTAAHFDRGKIGKAEDRDGTRSYPQVGMILQVYDHELYTKYNYPAEAFGLDDRHLALEALRSGWNFRVCMDAPFTKSRYQPGGQGPVESRARKTGLAISRLARDFPEYVGAVGTLRIPWQFLLDARAHGGITANRLVGGAMRKETALNTRVVIKRKKL